MSNKRSSKTKSILFYLFEQSRVISAKVQKKKSGASLISMFDSVRLRLDSIETQCRNVNLSFQMPIFIHFRDIISTKWPHKNHKIANFFQPEVTSSKQNIVYQLSIVSSLMYVDFQRVKTMDNFHNSFKKHCQFQSVLSKMLRLSTTLLVLLS